MSLVYVIFGYDIIIREYVKCVYDNVAVESRSHIVV